MARGLKKNLLLTLWLIAPIAVVTLLCVWIFTSFERGPAMNAPGRGVGAEDTGGANALGEWLAGRDPDEVQRIKRDLREGVLIDPRTWPGGVEFRVTTNEGAAPPSAIFILPGGSLNDVFAMTLTEVDATQWSILLMPEDFAEGHQVVIAPGGGSFELNAEGVVVRGPGGEALNPMVFEPISNQAERDSASPIQYELDLTEQAESGG